MSEQKPPAAYKVDDQELLLGFYKKLVWNRLVPRIPASITPNTLTVIGQATAVLAAITCITAATGGYPILYVVTAILLFSYLTFDNIDGAHARRTGQCSQLGEFLDHGLDGMASGAVLIVTAFVLQLDGMMMTLLCGIGALGFTMLFWEQFRTGLLVIPKVSSTEGVTLLIIFLTLLAVAGEPRWLEFSMTSVTPGTIIVLVVLTGYIAACVPPVLRAKKLGVRPWELIPLAAVIGAQVAFTGLGAMAILPSIAAGLIGADVTCRLIILRHRGESGPFLSPSHWLASLPVLVPAFFPGVWTATGWSAISLGMVVLSYGMNLWRGSNELLRPAPQPQRVLSP
ncbi:MAG: CDP-alcohol phosphatidyltransferase family protein [Myxococcota bacterium]